MGALSPPVLPVFGMWCHSGHRGDRHCAAQPVARVTSLVPCRAVAMRLPRRWQKRVPLRRGILLGAQCQETRFISGVIEINNVELEKIYKDGCTLPPVSGGGR